MSNRERDIAVWANTHVIQALRMRKSYARDYKLNHSNLFFEIDQRVRDTFKKQINEERLKRLIQEKFDGALYTLDYCQLGYLDFVGLPIVWHITFLCKKSGQKVKPIYLKNGGQGNFFDYKLTVHRAKDFQRVNELGEVNE